MALLSWGPTGCHPSLDLAEDSVASPAESKAVGAEPAAPGIDWATESDCQGKLRLLQAGLANGSIESLDTTPFALVSDQTPSGRNEWSGFGQRGHQAQDSDHDDAVKRCVIRAGRASDQKTEHRVLAQEQVRSSYQSGSRGEKNPAYEAAQARLRQAERASKPSKSPIITVGDPLIDLVGTLVGGAITGVGQWGAGDGVEEAIDALMATPRTIEQPVYRPYQFERTRIRASREATMPVMMTDRQLGESWRVLLKRREVRDLAVMEGLDRQDRHYAEHRENSMTDQEFSQWQTEPPELPLDDMIAGLLDAPSTSLSDRIAGIDRRVDRGARFAADNMLDAAALPKTSSRNPPVSAGRPGVRPSDVMQRSLDAAQESLVDIVATDHREKGVYVAPTFVLTTSDLVENLGLVDVRDRRGGSVLGLVAAVDRGLGLALIQVPHAGRPVRLVDGPWSMAGRLPSGVTPAATKVGDGTAADSGVIARSNAGGSAESGPVLDGDYLLGVRARHGFDIPIDDVKTFLTEQQHVLRSEG